jgi:hypothetical protein
MLPTGSPCEKAKEQPMTIRQLLENSAFGPEEIERLVVAYEQALSVFALKDRDDFATRVIARKIIKVAQTGERDAEQICQRAIAELSRAA